MDLTCTGVAEIRIRPCTTVGVVGVASSAAAWCWYCWREQGMGAAVPRAESDRGGQRRCDLPVAALASATAGSRRSLWAPFPAS